MVSASIKLRQEIHCFTVLVHVAEFRLRVTYKGWISPFIELYVLPFWSVQFDSSFPFNTRVILQTSLPHQHSHDHL